MEQGGPFGRQAIYSNLGFWGGMLIKIGFFLAKSYRINNFPFGTPFITWLPKVQIAKLSVYHEMDIPSFEKSGSFTMLVDKFVPYNNYSTACRAHLKSCRVNGLRLANDSEHTHTF